ncbi:MAG TPA: EthD family reductase [Solirubrobacterales bacterium]
MPYKLFAYWSAPRPEDVEEFERYYAETHVPRAAAVPNLLRINTTRTADGFEGAATDHYRVAEMVFASPEALAESAESDEWATMRQCSGDIIERFGVTMRVEMGEVEEGTGSAA